MKLSLLTVFGLLAAGWASAQDTDSLEIRGIVMEVGLNTGAAGVQITVYQFSKSSERTVFATGTTDSLGIFVFHPTQAGSYYVEATKPGYVATMGYQGPTKPLPAVTGSLAAVSHDHPQEFVRLALMRLAELKGRVVDENDKPLGGVLVEALDPGMVHTQESPLRTEARTTRDGLFSIKNLPPRQYIVRISSPAAGPAPVVTKFSDDELNAVDQELEPSYWPGVRDISAAARVTLVPGEPMDLGNLRMRKGPFYRVRVSVRGCRPGDQLQFSMSAASRAVTELQADGTSAKFTFAVPSSLSSCDDFLVRDLPPDSYEFALQSKQGWALVPVEVVNKNLFVTIAMNPDADVTGLVVAAHDDMQLAPALKRVAIRLTAIRSFAASLPMSMLSVSASGTFSFKGIRGPRHAVIVTGLSSGFYVKEIRSDGVSAPDGIVTLSSGSHIEVVIDDQPATLTGAVTDGGKPYGQPKIYVSRWPATLQPLPGMTSAPTGTGDGAGKFQIAGLPPGEYRVLAVPSGPIPDGASAWNLSPQLWDRAERVTLERGKQKEVTLKLADPFLER